MLVFGQIIAVFISLVNVDHSIADPDPRVISYEDKSNAVIFSDTGVTYFSQLLFDVTREQLVVGARDRIYRLTIEGLQVLESATWPAEPEKITSCLEKGQSETDCRNYVKVLLSYGNQLFACGTHAFSPKCSWRELDNVTRVTRWIKGLAMCPYSPRANTTSLMSEKGVYFAGTTMDFAGTYSAIIKDVGRTILRTDMYNAKWLYDPQFVGSFETDAYVYFLFREDAVEYMNCGKKIYSRIARVCKNDAGGQMMLRDNWTTFVKARLNCSLPGEYPFYLDEIQGVTFLPDNGMMYATFTTPKNSIAGSAVCLFNLKTIEAAFNGPYKHQESIGSAWERTSNYQTSKQCQNSNVFDSVKYQLMDNAVQPISQTPLYFNHLETIVHIAVDVIATKLDREMYVLYVSTDENVIKKISVLPRTMKTCVLEIWKPLPETTYKILTMHFLRQTESLYVGTEHEVIRVPAQHCKRHTTKQACMEAMDPYCGWNELKLSCTPPPDKNPLTPYWHQQVIDCPAFTHPVPGGWSEWSTWVPCNQANTNGGENVDQCMCSTRQCTNPAPQNGGAYCEGVSTQVTNCTLHGGWTNWSEWSACSESCGLAVKTRKRSCSNPAPAFGGRVCVGSDTDTTSCLGNPPCPEPILPVVDGAWTPWSPWSECSAKCGTGFRNRSRRCENPPPQKPDGLDCQGSSIEYELCNAQPCLEVKRLSDWTPWTTIGNTTEKRFKFVCKAPASDPKLIKIAIAKEEMRICESYGQCYYRSGSMEVDDSSWSDWSSCSVECGGGEQYRIKMCDSRNQDCSGAPKQIKRCNTHACRGEWGCWTDWSSCSVTCGVGVRQRTRVCLSVNNRSVESVGCDGSSVSQERCEMQSCDGDGEGWLPWSAWSDCDESNQQYRKRNCSVRHPTGTQCTGTDTEARICYSVEINDASPIGVQSGQTSQPPSTATLVLFCFVSFGIGVCMAAAFSFYWAKKHPYTVPSSPHYISKQNPYVTVPLKEVSTLPKRTPSFSKGALTANGGTMPKILAKTASNGDYETATIKRNSHSLLNGHARSSTLEQERFF